MKMSSTILATTLAIGIAGVFGSNFVLKKEYDRLDKSDPYWNFKSINSGRFTHLVINGGNISNIVLEQSPHNYVKVLGNWRGSEDGSVKTHINNDTLYVNFSNQFIDLYEKYWLRDVVPVRISTPKLYSVTGLNTKLVVDKFSGRNLKIILSGDARIQVNCFTTEFDTVAVKQADSSLVAFTVSEELFVPDSIHIKRLIASNSGTSLLNLRTASIDSVDLSLTESASAALSGYSLQRWRGASK